MGLTTKDQDYVAPSNNGEVWVKGLKVGDNRVRILQPVGTFEKYLEHFAEGPGYFACDGSPKCPGCTDDSERTRNKSWRWAFNVIEANGRHSVIKVGSGLREELFDREQRSGTLMDRDMILIRKGSGLQTKYRSEAGDAYEVEMPDKLYDVANAVGRLYVAACEAFGIAPNVVEDYSEVWMPPYGVTRVIDTPPANSASTDAAPADPSTATLERDPKDPSTWPTTEVKAYLDEFQLEYPAKAPRGRLVAIAREHLTDSPNF